MGGGVQHQQEAQEVTESSPLLSQAERPRRPPHRPTLSLASIASVRVPKVHNGRTIVNLLCLIAFIVALSNGFTSVPVIRIFESVICEQEYGLREGFGALVGKDNDPCKADAIQAKVAFIVALQSSFTAATGFIAAFPWGLLADKLGRKPVFAFCLLGALLNIFWQMIVVYFHNIFPIELVWLGAAGYLIGGGTAVLTGMILSMMTDSTTEEERAIAFMRLHVASLCGELVSPALTSIMMKRVGPWPPIWVAVATLIVSGIVFLFVPETLKHQPDQADDDADEVETDTSSFKSQMLHVITRFRESFLILKSTSLIILLLTSLAAKPVMSTLDFMVQFISKRYDIELEETGYVQSISGVAQVIQTLIILPWIARFIMKDTTPARFRPTGEHHRDLSLTRWSYGILLVGTVALGLAPTLPAFILELVIMALGSGFNSLTRSLMSLYVDPEHRSRLFSLVGIMEVIGSVYAQPMLAGLFALGMKLGGGWIGLPYYGLSILVAAATIMLLFVRVPKEHRDSSTTSEDAQEQGVSN